MLMPLALLAVACKEAPRAEPVATPVVSKVPTPATPPWSYEGDTGPAHWGSLTPAFAACSAGSSQSPVNLVASGISQMPLLQATHKPAALHVAHHEHVADGINTGHTIQVNYPGADTLVVGDEKYALIQYHFHSPSEHTVEGRHLPLEMHMVHKASDGRLAVVAVFMAEGRANAALAPIWANLPANKGDEVKVAHVQVDVDELMPSTLTTYRYDGSLTTPPCSEGVKWYLMSTLVEVSPEQVEAFRAVVRNNNRPVQALNGRAIQTDKVAER
jgi:carbonic anhydrase